jgi:hypothetical protein
VNQHSKYLLLLDPRPEVLSLQETALRCFYPGEVLTLESASDVQDIFTKKGHPELIIADALMLTHFKNLGTTVPLIATVNSEVSRDSLPEVTAILEKPISVSSLSYLVKNITSPVIEEPSHVPVRTSLLLRRGITLCDLYLKLSEKNFVKVILQGEMFSESDFKKMNEKSVFELYIKFEDSKEFLNFLEKELSGASGDSLEDITLAIENIESLERIAKSMQWSPSVLLTAQKSVSQAVKILSKNQNIIALLKKRLARPSNAYSRHIGLLSYMVCAFSSSIGLTGESGQVKLALAALIHDAAVGDEFYEDIKEWNRRAADPHDKTPETIKYRMHPFEASKIVKALDSHSPDVDQIILQHHELKNGSGFPRGLDSVRIGHLPALFIIVEDLVEFIGDGENIETSIIDFITWGNDYYDAGHFKKIFQSFQAKLRQL